VKEITDPYDLKEEDRKKILDFMKGRAEVMVHDIVENSGADKMLVLPILCEEAHEERVTIIRENDKGEPEIVSLN
jgi:hypothetical protein